ncbi:LysR family transcriptional regulator [Vibrio navarrensis]|uniref:LysR family transcriptional regulator n=1 Tax=Vibrio navarrensis TaxID=29495 RepID=UPI00186A925A|nr:LysR family transcriptional regulator [Vibrio navarrensis]MBE4601116.1 LysR family transcriptional regulator [Vibrio navarrensis]
MELLRNMSLFVEVCKVMNFRRAAESLDMPSSTLSRRISQLEQDIGLRLLHRTTRKVELTEAGQIYYERCKRIVDEANLAHEQLGAMLEQPSGLLRASVPVDFAIIYMAPLLAEFAALYPGIQIELDMTPRQADLISENVDVAIRMGTPPDSNLIARKLTEFKSQLFASPDYLALAGIPAQPDELQHYDCIGFPKIDKWTLVKGSESLSVEVGGKFRVNNVGMMKRLAVLNQGVIMLPDSAVEDERKNKQLVPVLGEWSGLPLCVYALTETRLLPAKVRVFVDFLKEKLASQ